MKKEAVFVHIWASESSGDTPLHFCARSGDLYAFQLLLNHVPHADIALQISNESGEDVWSLGWIRNRAVWDTDVAGNGPCSRFRGSSSDLGAS